MTRSTPPQTYFFFLFFWQKFDYVMTGTDFFTQRLRFMRFFTPFFITDNSWCFHIFAVSCAFFVFFLQKSTVFFLAHRRTTVWWKFHPSTSLSTNQNTAHQLALPSCAIIGWNIRWLFRLLKRRLTCYIIHQSWQVISHKYIIPLH